MFRLKPQLLSPILCLLLASCESFGPLQRGAFEPKLRSDINIADERIEFYSPAVIFPGITGYELPGALMMNRVKESGVLVLSSESIYFVTWKNEKYEERWRLPHAGVEFLELRSFGAGRRIVVKFNKQPNVVSLDVSGDSGQMIDPERAISACRLIAQRSGIPCLDATRR